jgi:hypothetical protein
MAGLVLAALGVAGCSSQPAPSGASVASCVQFGETAIREHVTVTALPPACQGLTAAQVDSAVATALRSTVSGVRGKAQQRQLIAAASGYLAPMFVAVPAPAGGPPPSSAPGGWVSKTTWGLLALATWLATVALGLSLLARRTLRDRRHGTRTTRPRRPPALNLAHMGLGGVSLLAWIVYLATAVTGVAWAAAGLLPLVAGLGMALLFLSWVAGPASGTAGSTGDGTGGSTGIQRRRTPVLIVGAHITFATATILFAVLAAIGTG